MKSISDLTREITGVLFSECIGLTPQQATEKVAGLISAFEDEVRSDCFTEVALKWAKGREGDFVEWLDQNRG